MRLRDVQRGMANAQAYRTVFVSLINDTMEYSKRNQAIDPILEAAGFKTKAPAPTAPGKTSGK